MAAPLRPAQVRARSRRVFAHYLGVLYALLFGSTARGEAGPGSDIDILIAGSVGPAERLALENDLELVLGRAVQVVAVEASPASLRSRAFRDGLVLLDRDPARRISDQADAIIEYLDFKPVEALSLAAVRARARAEAARGR